MLPDRACSPAPVAGMRLLHVEAPVFAGPRLGFKSFLGRCAAALLLILLFPLFAVAAAAIKAGRKGPVSFRHERVGKSGETFPMLKFRTMVVGAEGMLPSLRERSEGEGPLFKAA
jgi:lipopolysaccharide/colanic/teichoic acid biosynthesis glycosyltransferase